jgi:hypothetical protein
MHPYKDTWNNSFEFMAYGAHMVLSIVGLVFSMHKNVGEAYSANSFPAKWVANLFEAFSLALPMGLVLVGVLFVFKELRQRRRFLSFKKTNRNFMEVTDRPVEEPDEEEIEDAIARKENMEELFRSVNDGTMTALQFPDAEKKKASGVMGVVNARLRPHKNANRGKDGLENEDPSEAVKYGRGMFRIYFQVRVRAGRARAAGSVTPPRV